ISDRITADPSAAVRIEVAKAIIEKSSLPILVFATKAERKIISDARLNDGLTKGRIIEAAGNSQGGCVDPCDDISVRVRAGRERLNRRLRPEEAADATGALHRSAQVGAPDVLSDYGVSIERVAFLYQVPAIVDEAEIRCLPSGGTGLPILYDLL